MKPRVAVIGAGWAGLAAAVELAPQVQLTVFEAGRTPGGRARRMQAGSQPLDNGQHILLGAYRACLRMMHRVGAEPERALLRLPLVWHQVDGLFMRCLRLPAPLHLLSGLLLARGLSWRNKWQLARALGSLSLAGWQVPGDPSVASWLAAHGQDETLQGGFWRPLVLSALNTPLEQASMRILAAVLRDSLGGTRADSDLLLPRRDLSALFPDPAWQWLARQGADLRAGHRVATLESRDGGFLLDGESFDAVVVACAPYHAAALIRDEKLSSAVKTMQFWPIYTVYLCFDRSPGLPGPMVGLQNGTAHWLFDREQLCNEAGLVAAVISAPDLAQIPENDALVARVLSDLRRVVPGLPDPLWTRVLADKRATFAARAGISRPAMRLGVQSLYLAGDWVESDYPATLEGAVRSGLAAADALMRDLNQKKCQ